MFTCYLTSLLRWQTSALYYSMATQVADRSPNPDLLSASAERQ